MNEWTKVSEMPRTYGEYLCCVLIPTENGKYKKTHKVLKLSERDRKRCFVCNDMIVTHWMPLPELPEVKIWD